MPLLNGKENLRYAGVWELLKRCGWQGYKVSTKFNRAVGISTNEAKNVNYSLVDYQIIIWSLDTTQRIPESQIQTETYNNSPYGDKWQELQSMSCLGSGSGSAKEK